MPIDVKKNYLFIRITDPSRYVRFFWQGSKHPKVFKAMGVLPDNTVEMQALRIHRSIAKKVAWVESAPVVGFADLAVSDKKAADELKRLLYGRGTSYAIAVVNKKEFKAIQEPSGTPAYVLEKKTAKVRSGGRGWHRQSRRHARAAEKGQRQRRKRIIA